MLNCNRALRIYLTSGRVFVSEPVDGVCGSACPVLPGARGKATTRAKQPKPIKSQQCNSYNFFEDKVYNNKLYISVKSTPIDSPSKIMVDQFGVTLHGWRNPIGSCKRDDFNEPRRISFEPKKLSREDRAWNFPKGLDVYDLVLDGYSYSSRHLLQQIKHKKFIKPYGPTDVYRVPIVSSMDVGWFLSDPALRGQNWMDVRNRYPWPWSETTRFLDHVRRVDKFCNM